MNIFKRVVSKLFDKEEENIINDCIAFDDSGLVFTLFVRGDVAKDRLKFVIQEYLRQKQWYLRHTGPASMQAHQTEPDKRTLQVKIGFTAEKERIIQIGWSSPNPDSVYLFRDMMMELCDVFASQNLLKLQSKPIPALTTPAELKDIVEEEIVPVELLNPEKVLKNLRASSAEAQGLTTHQKAMAEYVVFEEDDEETGIFRVVCQLNKNCKVAYAASILANIANGLDCDSFEIQKMRSSAKVCVKQKGRTIEFEMTVGLNSDKERILHGTYPENSASYGRQFWIRFAEALAQHGCLKDQTVALPSNGSSRVSPRESNKNDQQKAEESDDSGLEYDSSDYDSSDSENSVDSDPE